LVLTDDTDFFREGYEMFNAMTKSSGKTSKALCHAVEILVFVTFFKDMNVPFDTIAYLIVFNIEGVASLHFQVDIDVIFCKSMLQWTELSHLQHSGGGKSFL
jgi:hypothetical protein